MTRVRRTGVDQRGQHLAVAVRRFDENLRSLLLSRFLLQFIAGAFPFPALRWAGSRESEALAVQS
jgi:hypothetical protein